MAMHVRPTAGEASSYYFKYIDQVPDGDILVLLEEQLTGALALIDSISADQSLSRYAPGKWSIRDVVSHLSDTERLFVFRAFWFARGFDSPLPSFEPDVAAAAAAADGRPWHDIVEEFRTVRAATLTFFRSLPAEAWDRRGVASGMEFSVRALAYLAAGHVTHHAALLRERYLAAGIQ